MKGAERLEAMAPSARRAFCQEVMERFSELVEGEAPPDFCRRVEEVLGGCPPYEALRNTLAATIELAHELGTAEAPSLDDEALARCAERVRQRLRGAGPP